MDLNGSSGVPSASSVTSELGNLSVSASSLNTQNSATHTSVASTVTVSTDAMSAYRELSQAFYTHPSGGIVLPPPSSGSRDIDKDIKTTGQSRASINVQHAAQKGLRVQYKAFRSFLEKHPEIVAILARQL